MLPDWVLREMKTADLDDKRLNDRLRTVLSQLGERPTASIPAACGGRAEMAAAYRLFDNEKATFERILEAHAEATRERIAAQPRVVFVADTTELDLTWPKQAVVGAGPLDGGARVGALLHLLHAFTPDGTPLGTTHAVAWSRDEGPVCAGLSRRERLAIPLEEKESHRWVQALEAAERVAHQAPATQCICVADSEADIYEMFVAGTARGTSIDWVVRAAQDRALCCENEDASRLREELLDRDVWFTQTIQVRNRSAKTSCETRRRRVARDSRQAEVEIRAARVTLRPPWRPQGKLPEVTVGAVLVHESSPPPGETRVEWLLLTSLPIEDADEVREVIQIYSVRWMIEVLFRVLKSGCRVEERRFHQLDRLLTCLAVYLVVAWRTLYLCRLGRSCPDTPCDAVFEPCEWKAVWKIVRREDPPAKPPTLGNMVRMVAQLGGYIPRTDPPGPQTLWIGLQRMHDFALCWETFGPEAHNRQFELV